MKADSAGNIWTSGRGGIYVFSPKGEHIGFAPIAGRVSNCAFGPGRYLYVTNDTQVVRGRIRPDFPRGLPIHDDRDGGGITNVAARARLDNPEQV